MAQVCADYWFMGGQGDRQKESIPVLVVWEKMLQGLFGHVVNAKGADPVAAKSFSEEPRLHGP